MRIRNLAVLLGLLLAGPTWAADKIPPPLKRRVDFVRDIQPILRQHCHGCHGAKKQEGNLRLDERRSLLSGGDSEKPAIVIGKSGSSPLIRRVAGIDADLVMPPKGKRLSAKQVGILRAWIDQGARGLADRARRSSAHWSYQPIRRPRIPRSTDARSRTAIDLFVLRKLREKKLNWSVEAGRSPLIRRLYLDLLGLLPSPAEVQRFRHDRRVDAYERLVDRVLASPRYGERWARHWLDIVRFADTNGFETNTPRPNAYHYRDYVIRSFNRDTPYREFITDQLAGDSTGEDAATGFLVAGAFDQVKSPDVNLTMTQRQDELADMINGTSTAFLAMTVACARCHNHKFDPILQTDFYGMQAVFAGVQHGERPLRIAKSADALKVRQELAKQVALHRKIAQQNLGKIPPQTCLVVDDGIGFTAGLFSHLRRPTATAVFPAGTRAGQRDETGGRGRLPHLGQGGYTQWKASAGVDVALYRPGVRGKNRIWLSWGSSPSHSGKVEYILDQDGNRATKTDQQLIASVDQRRWVGLQAQDARKPSWSGLYDSGVHELRSTSCVLIRATDGSPVSADAVVFQQLPNPRASSMPRIGAPINSRMNEERFAATKAKFIRFTIHATNGAEPCIDELEVFQTRSQRNIALQSNGAKSRSSGDFPDNPLHKLKHIHDGQFGNSRSWISNQNGRGWVQLEFNQVYSIDRIRWARDRQGLYSDRTATNYVIQVAVEPGKWKTVATAADHFRLGFSKKDAQIAEIHALPRGLVPAAARQLSNLHTMESSLARQKAIQKVAYSGKFAEPGPTHRLHRGDPSQKREAVSPSAISILGALGVNAKAPERLRRKALADWMVRGDNPLTARVIANRIWHYHFGVGIVRTPSDFGANGAKPTHPRLLDWLASELIANGWSLKRLQRQIVLSTTYRQKSSPRVRAIAIDASSTYLWRFPPRRLEAEVIRDNILLVSGGLDLSMYGPGFSVFKPNTNYVRVYLPKDKWGPAEWRRMVYMVKVRMERDDVFGAFDCPDAGQPTSRRSRSTTAIQALSLLNSQFMIQQSRLFAARLKQDAGNVAARQVDRAFALCFGRRPDPVELSASLQLINKHGLAAFCRAILNSSELLFFP